MKRDRINWVTIQMVAVVCIGFLACNKENNDGESTTSVIQTLRANKWVSRDASYGEESNDHAWVDVESTTLYFTSDNTGFTYWIQKDYDTNLGNTTTKDYITFSYTVSGNSVRIKNNGGSRVTYNLKDNYLVSESGGTIFVGSPLTSSDYDVIKALGPKEGMCGPNLRYSYNEKSHTMTISGTGKMYDYSPSTQPWRNYPVEDLEVEEGCASIGVGAFKNNKYLMNVSLPSTVQEIGAEAFYGTNLSRVYLPSGLVRIGEGAFDCEKIEYVDFDACKNLEEIDDYAFAQCPMEIYLTLPAKVKRVGSFAFMKSTIKKLTLNDKLEEVGASAFGTIKNTDITLPNSLRSIGTEAFVGPMREIRIGTGLREINKSPFRASTTGRLYVNLGNPIQAKETIVFDRESGWDLYVPIGSKVLYQKAEVWRNFKSINESSDLISGNGTQGEEIIQTHEYVDLGLPSGTLWATCNVGASKPEEYGDYFAWGGTTGYKGGKTNFTWSTYKYCNGSGKTMTKYCTGSDYGIVDNKTVLESADDAATANWGGGWQMPSFDQCEELINSNYTTTTWTTQNGVYGRKIISKSNGKNIFLPAAGYLGGTSFCEIGSRGSYWSRLLWRSAISKGDWGSGLDFDSSTIITMLHYRYYGQSVRPVRVHN